MMKSTSILGIFFLLAVFWAQLVFAAAQPMSVTEIDEKITYTVLENGDMQAVDTLTLSAAAYQQFKENYPTLSTFARLFKPANTPMQMENMDIKLDDMANKITATYLVKGAAINKGEYWEMEGGEKKVTLSAQTPNSLIFTSMSQSGDTKLTTTSTINFPANVQDLKFDTSTNNITYKVTYIQMSSLWGWILGGGLFIFSFGFLILAALNHFLLKY